MCQRPSLFIYHIMEAMFVIAAEQGCLLFDLAVGVIHLSLVFNALAVKVCKLGVLRFVPAVGHGEAGWCLEPQVVELLLEVLDDFEVIVIFLKL